MILRTKITYLKGKIIDKLIVLIYKSAWKLENLANKLSRTRNKELMTRSKEYFRQFKKASLKGIPFDKVCNTGQFGYFITYEIINKKLGNIKN